MSYEKTAESVKERFAVKTGGENEEEAGADGYAEKRIGKTAGKAVSVSRRAESDIKVLLLREKRKEKNDRTKNKTCRTEIRTGSCRTKPGVIRNRSGKERASVSGEKKKPESKPEKFRLREGTTDPPLRTGFSVSGENESLDILKMSMQENVSGIKNYIRNILKSVKKMVKAAAGAAAGGFLSIMAPVLSVAVIMFIMYLFMFRGVTESLITGDTVLYTYLNADMSYDEVCSIFPIEDSVMEAYDSLYEKIEKYIKENNTEELLTDTGDVNINRQYVIRMYAAYEMTLTRSESLVSVLLNTEDLKKFLKNYIKITGEVREGVYAVSAVLCDMVEITKASGTDIVMYRMNYNSAVIHEDFISRLSDAIPEYEERLKEKEPDN